MNTPAPGKIKEISSTANPIIKDIKALALKKNRDRDNTFIAEGLKLATDALDAGWTIKTLIHAKNVAENAGLAEKVQNLAATVRARGGDVLIVNDKILTSITRRDNAQMVVSLLAQNTIAPEKVQPKENECWLALDRVRDPGNLGTIIRTADCLGAKGVILVGDTTDPFALEAVRATMGSLFHVPLVKMSETDFISFASKWRRDFEGQVIGTHLNGAVDHRKIEYATGPQLLLMGNEQQGLTDALAQACDQLALIPMAGKADSLNLAVATGIMLFEARRHAL